MYNETLKPIDESKNTFTFTTILVFSLIIIIGISNFLYSIYQSTYITYSVFILFIAIGVYVYRRKIAGYRYSLTKSKIIFETIVGTRERLLMNINLKDIVFFDVYQKRNEYEGEIVKKRNYLLKKSSPDAYVLIAKEQKGFIQVNFQPSSTMINLIKNSLNL